MAKAELGGGPTSAPVEPGNCWPSLSGMSITFARFELARMGLAFALVTSGLENDPNKVTKVFLRARRGLSSENIRRGVDHRHPLII